MQASARDYRRLTHERGGLYIKEALHPLPTVVILVLRQYILILGLMRISKSPCRQNTSVFNQEYRIILSYYTIEAAGGDLIPFFAEVQAISIAKQCMPASFSAREWSGVLALSVLVT